MARSKHILPFLLEGEVQEIDSLSSNTSWNRLTSFVNVNVDSLSHEFAVDTPLQKVPGALLSIHKQGDNGQLIVKLTTLALDDEFDTLALNDGNHSLLLMWNGEKWVVLSQSIEFYQGGTMSTNTTFTGTVRFANTVTTNQDAPPVAANNDDDLESDDVVSRIVVCTPTAARSKSTEDAATLNSACGFILDDQAFDFTFINKGTASGATVTLSGGTGVTFEGSSVIDEGTSATFRIRRTSATSSVIYRL